MSMRLSILAFLGVALALGPGAGPAYADQDVQVTLTEYSISPNPITVRAGERVRFMANNPATSQRPHDLRVEGQGVAFEVVPGDGNIAAGQSATAEMTFNTPGTYQMWCPVGMHRQQGMEGQFIVLAAGAAAPAAAQPARPPAQVPAALPRTGDPGTTFALGALALAGAGLATAGLMRRRKP